MINVKDQVYAALCTVFANVSDGYPKDWKAMPAVQYTEEENNVYEYSNCGEEKSYIRYRVDIWDEESTSGHAVNTDKAMAALGLKRVQCTDVDDPQSRYKHKMMRYEAVIDVETEMTYYKK
jgi:hypothetical protein